MKFTLKQVEIQAALGMYLGAQGIDVAGKSVTYAFKSGRGGNGVTVAVDIESEGIIVLGNSKPAKLGQLCSGNGVGNTKPVTAVDTIVGANTQAAEVEDTSAVAEVATEVAAEAAPATTLAEVEVAEVAAEFSAEVPAEDPVAVPDEPAPVQEVEAAPVSTSNIFGD